MTRLEQELARVHVYHCACTNNPPHVDLNCLVLRLEVMEAHLKGDPE